ncbi:hypothetical protein [Pseudomonas putida]|uniref:hypothetical protein n=1 Tax=Pseudomonas putida TaxID=303 RepID=UPI0000EBA234|nr:hypothetical protein [Pseudomonas putida]QQE84380.1 hypothetical protein JET17_01400 [Pseudomonas putida]UTL81477.1 hypothetical protein NL778_01240 [Pseudomonas putida]
MEWVAKAKTPTQEHSGYTGNKRVRNEFEGQEYKKGSETALRGVVQKRKASIIAASATTAQLMRAGTAGIPERAAQAALSGRDKRTM